jgi:RHS repeat-associated protein
MTCFPNTMRKLALALLLAMLGFCSHASAQSLHATLTNFTYNSGSSVFGSFDYNPVTGVVTNVAVEITTTAAGYGPYYIDSASASTISSQPWPPYPNYIYIDLANVNNNDNCGSHSYNGPCLEIMMTALPTGPGSYAPEYWCPPGGTGCGQDGQLPWSQWTDICNGEGCAGDLQTGGTLVVTYSGKYLGNNYPGQCQCGDPIDPATGNVFEQFTDYETAGQNKLSFIRYYNSLGLSAPTYATWLGIDWRTNFDRYLRILSSSTVTAERANGQQITFSLVGSTWTPDSDVDVKLTNSGSTWTLTDHDDTVETYTVVNSGAEGLLQTIQARNGYTQTLSYSGTQLTSVTDSYNRSLTFSYSGSTLSGVLTPDNTNISLTVQDNYAGEPMLTYVQYNSATPVTFVWYQYNSLTFAPGLTAVYDENRNVSRQWTYDGAGRGSTSELGNGTTTTANLTTLTYNSNGTTTVTNALGVADTYTFTTQQNLPKVTGISRAATSTTAAATESIGFDANGYINNFVDWNGNQTTYVNNTHGMPTTIDEAVGTSVARTTTIVYDPTWVHLPDSIKTTGVTTSFKYDGQGEMLTSTQTDTTTQTVPYSTKGQTRTTTYTYNNYLLASVETPNLNTTQFGYSSTGALTSVKDALGHITNITAYTGGGLPETIVDPNNVTTTLVYSGRQWLTSSTVSGTGGTYETTWKYDGPGNMIQKTLPDNSYLAPSYDTAYRITRVTDALGNYATYALDALGDVTGYTYYNSSGTSFKTHSDMFDALGRVLVDTGGRGQTVTYAYDPDGNATTVEDGFGKATTNVFDPLNRLSTSTDPNNGITTLKYDAHDRPLSVKDADGHTTTYVYDGEGDAIQQKSPDSGTTVYVYDSDSNLTQKTDALGNVMNAQYDALDRNTNMQYPGDTTKDVWKSYDQTGNNHGFSIGRLTSVADAAGCCYAIGYDERGNVNFGQRTIGSGYSTIYPTYDAAGRISGIGYPSGIFVGYSRDAMGRINQVFVNTVGNPTGQTVAWIANAPFGPMNYITYGNGVTGPYNLDADYSVSSIQQSTSGGTSLQNLTYTPDNNNNITGITDALNSANSQTLGYDIINRLNSAVSGSGGYGSYSWTYDKVGNRLTQKIGSVTTKYTYTSGTSQLSEIGSTAVSTNADGNITSIPPANSSAAATFSYGVDGRLTSVTGSPLGATFVTDFLGERFSKTDNGDYPTYYTYGTDGALLEETNNGTAIDYIYADGIPVGMFLPTNGGQSGTLYYTHDDRVGQPQFATNSSQSVVWSTTYQQFGTNGLITGSITQNLRFPGQYFDVETGFSNNHFRDYMPNLGRYLESDPIGLKGGMNTYAYAGSNPSKFFDRLGLEFITGPPPQTFQSWQGTPTAGPLETPMSVYRYSTAGQPGSWFSPTLYTDPATAIRELSLPESNTAEMVCRVNIPSGWQVQMGLAGPNLTMPGSGGGIQLQTMSNLPASAYGEPVPTGTIPAEPGPIETDYVPAFGAVLPVLGAIDFAINGGLDGPNPLIDFLNPPPGSN